MTRRTAIYARGVQYFDNLNVSNRATRQILLHVHQIVLRDISQIVKIVTKGANVRTGVNGKISHVRKRVEAEVCCEPVNVYLGPREVTDVLELKKSPAKYKHVERYPSTILNAAKNFALESSSKMPPVRNFRNFQTCLVRKRRISGPNGSEVEVLHPLTIGHGLPVCLFGIKSQESPVSGEVMRKHVVQQ